jgi:hypothetical protein
MTNSTVALNRVTSTSIGGSASAFGGGVIATSGASSIINSTIAGNAAAANANGGTSQPVGGGLFASSSTTLRGSIVANNTAAAGRDCVGGPHSDGGNLIRRLAGCSFTKKPSDVSGKDPKLGALKANGGPTRTMAIASTSPALNHIPTAACAVSTDERGVHRPQGPRCDIGAYERKPA